MMAMIGAATSAAAAVDPAPPAALDSPGVMEQLEITFTPGVWLTRVGGDATLGSGGTKIELDEQLELDDYEAAFNAELELRKASRWGLRLSGFDLETDSSGAFIGTGTFGSIALSDGQFVESEFRLTSIALEACLPAWRLHPRSRKDVELPASRPRAALDLEPTLGVRYLDIDQSLLAGSVEETGEGEWIAPMAGADLRVSFRPEEVPLLDELVVHAGCAFGPALGGDGGVVAQVRAGVIWNFSPNIGALVGYRLLGADVEQDGYEFDGSLQGLFLAAVIRF
jgi:hypothetical protein